MNDFDDNGPSPDTDAEREAKTLAKDARQAGQRAYEGAAEQATQAAYGAKGDAAKEVGNVSDALRAAADASRDGSPQERTFGQIADAMADFSDNIRDKDLGEITDEVNHFARRNPMAFLGGAALLGFAAVRFAKASQSGPRGSSPEHNVSGTTGTPRGPVPAGTSTGTRRVGTSDEIPAPHTISGGTR